MSQSRWRLFVISQFIGGAYCLSFSLAKIQCTTGNKSNKISVQKDIRSLFCSSLLHASFARASIFTASFHADVSERYITLLFYGYHMRSNSFRIYSDGNSADTFARSRESARGYRFAFKRRHMKGQNIYMYVITQLFSVSFDMLSICALGLYTSKKVCATQ